MKRHIRNASLPEIHSTVETEGKKGFFRKLLAFIGPAYLVSVGYMDPGNWATDIAGGSQFGYKLIWVLLMSNMIALLLQSLSARLGIVRGLDLAQASRENYPPFVNFYLYILAEIAIAACDLAEVLGMAIGLQLLFHIPLLWGVGFTVLDTFLLLLLQSYGMRKLEAFIFALIMVIGFAFLAEMFFAHPVASEVAAGFLPGLPGPGALYIAIGIIGATVMPHNLYLHSSLVQSRKINRSSEGLKSAIKFNFIDSTIALNLAFFVNSAILILSAATFFKNGLFEVADIKDAHQFLQPLLGTHWAPLLFAVALIAAGQSSTITGTLAGQVVMEGYLNLRIQPWLRRLITRSIAIIPAFIVVYLNGEPSTGSLLILSQVILSIQLGFAIIPLIHLVSDKQKMGEFTIKPWVKLLSWLSAGIIVILNVKLVIETIGNWLVENPNSLWIRYLVIPLVLFSGLILLYITFSPFIYRLRKENERLPHKGPASLGHLKSVTFKNIAICVDFSDSDSFAISQAISQGGKHANYTLLHVVETAGALLLGNEIQDRETDLDSRNIQFYIEQLKDLGYNAEFRIGHGNPKIIIPQLASDANCDLLVMGAHGHKMWKDLIFGTTVEKVRHKINIPLLIVKKS